MKVKSQLVDAQLEQTGTNPTKKSQITYDTNDDLVKYGDGSNTKTLVEESASQTLTNKTLTSPVLDTGVSGTAVLDEDDMASDSATKLATQQSIKAYVDDQVALSSGGASDDLTAHEADTTTHGVSGVIVGTAGAQTIIDKTLVVSDNTITTAASGNLTSTELNDALAELQTDIDTRALDSDLDTHIADTSTHGVSGDVVGTSDAQTLTNKTFDDEITLKELEAAPSAPSAGYKTFYAKDNGKVYTKDSDGNESEVGSGSGGGKNYFVDPNYSSSVDAATVYNDIYTESVKNVTIASNVLTVGTHSFEDGDYVLYTSPTPITGLTSGDYYYIINSTSTTFSLSLTSGGSAVAVSENGELLTTDVFTRFSYDGGRGSTTEVHLLSRSVETTAPLAGLGSLKVSYTYDADYAGLGFEGIRLETKTIDREDRGKALTFTVYIDPTDENYPSGDLNFRVFDKTNNKELYVSGDTSITNEEGTYRLLVYTTSTTAEINFTLNLDDDNATDDYALKFGTFSLGPDAVVPVPIVGQWQDYVPETQGLGTITLQSARWMQDGPNYIIDVRLVAGTVTDDEAQISLPNGAAVKAGYDGTSVVGTAVQDASSSGSPVYMLATPGDSFLNFSNATSGQSSKTFPASGDGAFTSSSTILIRAVVPIEGLSSAMLSTTELLNRSAKVIYYGNGGESLTNSTNIPFATKDKDVLGSWDGDDFEAPVDGFYAFEGIVVTTSSTVNGIYSFVDGSDSRYAGPLSDGRSMAFGGMRYLTKGQKLSFRHQSGSSFTLSNSENHHVSIWQVFDPTSYSEYLKPIVFSARQSGTAISSSYTTPTSGWTVDEDTESGFNSSTGEYTVQVPGYYDINASAGGSSSGSGNIILSVNETAYRQASGYTASATYPIAPTITVLGKYLAAGDIIKWKASFSASTTTDAARTYFEVTWRGPKR